MPLNIKCKDCRDFAPAPTLPHKGVCKRMVLRSDPNEVRGCGCFYPASKADRIRAMTDEELAEWVTTKGRTFGEEYEGFMSLLDWLKSPVKQEVDNGT